jgi:hypothetical protein
MAGQGVNRFEGRISNAKNPLSVRDGRKMSKNTIREWGSGFSLKIFSPPSGAIIAIKTD